jgi:hypothetical protein
VFTVSFETCSCGDTLQVRWRARYPDQAHRNARCPNVVAVAFYPLATRRVAAYVMSLWRWDAEHGERVLLNHNFLHSSGYNEHADEDPGQLFPTGWSSEVHRALRFSQALVDQSIADNLWATRVG